MSAYRFLSLIRFNGADFLKGKKKALVDREDVPICKISQGLLLLRGDERFPPNVGCESPVVMKLWQCRSQKSCV